MSYIEAIDLKNIILNALKEDIGEKDITCEMVIPRDKKSSATIIVKEDCVVCGINIALEVFKLKDASIEFEAHVKDGQTVKAGKKIASLHGNTASILTAERVALNFLSFLSGISTKVREYTLAIKPYKIKIVDTRKTLPNLRELQKYAVRMGGGFNHRMTLDEMVLVKDNHLKAIGGVENLPKLFASVFIRSNTSLSSQRYQFEIEVEDIKQFKVALKFKPDIIMLDNMSIAEMKHAVKLRNKFSPDSANRKPKLEASGSINLKNIKKVASCGIDMISIGSLTHSISSVDIGLEIK